MRAIIILMTAGAAAAGAACGEGRDARMTVAAAFYPLAFAAREIAPPGAEVVDLTPGGAEPHDLEPTPREVARVRAAEHVLLMGHGFQPALEQAAGDRANVARLLDTPGLRRLGRDPHVWLDPLRFAVVARRIGAVLGERERAARLAARLEALDAAFRAGLATCRRRTLVTSHDAFRYLADRYRLDRVAVGGIDPGAEPPPRALERTVATVRARGVTTVFTQPRGPRRLAAAIARESGTRVGELDPIETITAGDRRRGRDYFSLMRANLAALRRGLGCS